METVQLEFAVSLCVCLNDKIKTALIFYWNVNFDSLTHLTSLTGKFFCVDNFDSFSLCLLPIRVRRVVQLRVGFGYWKNILGRVGYPNIEDPGGPITGLSGKDYVHEQKFLKVKFSDGVEVEVESGCVNRPDIWYLIHILGLISDTYPRSDIYLISDPLFHCCLVLAAAIIQTCRFKPFSLGPRCTNLYVHRDAQIQSFL